MNYPENKNRISATFRFLALLIVVFATTSLFAQESSQDLIYLKNGAIIRGRIIEQVPGESITIETVNEDIFVFNLDEIEKIVEEPLFTDDKIAYLGISVGLSIPVGDFADITKGAAKAGIQINALNFGYLLSENYGVSALVFHAINPLHWKEYEPWSFSGVMAGFLASYAISYTLDFDFRAMIGYSFITSPDAGTAGKEESSSFAIQAGIGYRFNFSERFGTILNIDYYTTKPEFEYYNFGDGISTINVGVGMVYRFK